MKQIKALLFTLVIAAVWIPAIAGEPAKDDIVATFHRQADFKINYALSEGGFSIKLYAEYLQETEQYKIYRVNGTVKDTAPFLVMDDPLNYEVFYQSFYDSLKVVLKQNELPAFANNSVQSVFTWLYTLRVGDEDDIVNSGTLWLKKWIYVFGPEEANTKLGHFHNMKKRDSTLSKITDRYQGLVTYEVSLKNELDSLFTGALKLKVDTVNEYNAFKNANDLYNLKQIEFDVKQTEIRALEKDTLDASKDSDFFQQKKVNIAQLLSRMPLITRADTIIKDSLTGELGNVEKQIENNNKKIIATKEQLIKQNSKKEELSVEKKALLEVLNKRLDDLKERKSYMESSVDKGIFTLRDALQKLRNGTLDKVSYDSIKARMSRDIKYTRSQQEYLDTMYQRYSRIKDELKIYIDIIQHNHIYKVNKISLQFQRGTIERIQVWVENGFGGENIFENISPIAITSINNLKSFTLEKLILRPYSNYNYIMLSDVLGNYDNVLSLYTRDYSPADSELNSINPSADPYIVLRKEKMVNLFDSKIYTDVEGFRADKPNGLVQIEIARRFNIHTTRERAGRRTNWTYFNCMNAYGALTKIEQKDRRLLLRNEDVIVNNKLVSPSYATNLDLRNYENAHIGLDLNVFLFDCPDGKFTLYANIGARYGHTSLTDSMRAVVNGKADTPSKALFLDSHTITYALPKLSMEFFSERRVGLTLTWQYNYTFYMTGNYFKPIVSYAKSDLTALPIERDARFSHMFEFLMRVETSKKYDSRIFLRARYFMQRGDINTFFPQIQLGYAYNLILRK